jgi:hypothetical protein
LDVATKAPNDQRLVYSIYIGLASLYEARHQCTDAEQQYECAYTAAKTAFGGESEEVAKAINHIGEMRLERGRVREADWSFHQTLTILESNKETNRIATAAVLKSCGRAAHDRQFLQGSSTNAQGSQNL